MILLGNHLLELELDGDLAVVHEYDPSNVGAGARATPIRFKLSDSGGRVAADFPGVDPSLFIVGGSNSVVT